MFSSHSRTPSAKSTRSIILCLLMPMGYCLQMFDLDDAELYEAMSQRSFGASNNEGISGSLVSADPSTASNSGSPAKPKPQTSESPVDRKKMKLIGQIKRLDPIDVKCVHRRVQVDMSMSVLQLQQILTNAHEAKKVRMSEEQQQSQRVRTADAVYAAFQEFPRARYHEFGQVQTVDDLKAYLKRIYTDRNKGLDFETEKAIFEQHKKMLEDLKELFEGEVKISADSYVRTWRNNDLVHVVDYFKAIQDGKIRLGNKVWFEEISKMLTQFLDHGFQDAFNFWMNHINDESYAGLWKVNDKSLPYKSLGPSTSQSLWAFRGMHEWDWNTQFDATEGKWYVNGHSIEDVCKELKNYARDFPDEIISDTMYATQKTLQKIKFWIESEVEAAQEACSRIVSTVSESQSDSSVDHHEILHDFGF